MADTIDPPVAAPGRPRPYRWGLWLGLPLAALVLVLGLLAAGLVWLLSTPTGLAKALVRVPGLQVEGVQGAPLAEQLKVQSLGWTSPDGSLAVQVQGLVLEQPRWRWRPHPGLWLSLASPRAAAQRVHIRSAASSTAAALPSSLRLPVAAELAKVQIGELQLNDLPVLREVQAQLSLAAQAGSVHRVQGLSAQIGTLKLSGQAQIGADAPMPAQAELQVTAADWQAQGQIAGALATLAVSAQLRGLQANGQPVTLDASATVRPAAAWPLSALQLRSQALDLSRLGAGLPRTALDVQAEVDTQGVNQPVAARITLTNRMPGAWSEGRLPIATLSLDAAAPDLQTQRLDIRRLQLQLADAQGSAGQWQGQGEWTAKALTLDSTVQGLLPARLDARAPALRLAGPVQLRLQGLPAPASLRGGGAGLAPDWRLGLDGQLEGQLVQGPPQPWRAQLQATLGAGLLELTPLKLQAGPAQAELKAQFRRQNGAWQLAGQGQWRGVEPLAWWPGAPAPWRQTAPHRSSGSVQADLRLRPPPAGADALAWLRALKGQAQIELKDTLLAGVPLSGQARLRSDAGVAQWQADVSAAGNQARGQGRWVQQPEADQWQLDLQAPALAGLAPWARLMPGLAWPSAGALQANTRVDGRWPNIVTQGQAELRGLKVDDAHVERAQLRWQAGTAADARWDIALDAQGLGRGGAGGARLQRLLASVQGTRAQHQLQASLDSPLRPPAWTEPLLGPAGDASRLDLAANGRWAGDATGRGSSWSWQAGQLRVAARTAQAGSAKPWLEAQALTGVLRLGPGGAPLNLELAPGRANLPAGAGLRWQRLFWQPAQSRLEVKAELETLAVAPLLARLQPDLGWGGDLKVTASIDVQASTTLAADVVFERQAGDLHIRDEGGNLQALGLSVLRMGLTARDGQWQFTQGLAGAQLGEMAGAQWLRTGPQARWPAPGTPLEGVLELRVANLGAWGTWVPPGWRLGGQLRVGAAFGGTWGAPQLRGEMQGSGLAVRNVLQGVSLAEGTLAATLQGEQVRVDRFEFKGGDGSLVVTGGATLGASPSASLKFSADRFRVLGRIDRRLVASGSADLKLTPDRLELGGRVELDEGLIDISRADAPALDEDVLVRRAGQPEAAASAANGRPRAPGAAMPAPLRNARVNVALGLGPQLRLRGRGLNTLLRGELQLSSPGGRLALAGTVRAEQGTYVAYGQTMDIERGEVVFTGLMDNPRLDIRAVRPRLDVQVGVAVSGTAQSPRVRLFSVPEMGDLDKLSWLVLGRPSDGLGRTDTALLQRAAVALLAGEGEAPTDSLLKSLGLTDFSLRQTDGDVRDTVVSLGRQLSQRWYVGYERSVNATAGTWQLVYRAAQRFTLRAQSGQENALDLIWSWRW